MPHRGVLSRLEPTEEQKALYHKMIDWGERILSLECILTVEPSETVEKDGDMILILS